MPVVSIKINGRDYQVACDDGQEEHLRLLADEIDDRVRSLTFGIKSKPGEAMALVMAALMMADELTENQKKIEFLRKDAERLSGMVGVEDQSVQESRIAEMENAMAVTLDEIAQRIERIAAQID